MIIRELNAENYSALRKKLIDKESRGGVFQRNFLLVLRDSKEFTDWLQKEVDVLENEEDVALVPDKLSEHEFKEPTQKVENQLFQSWRDILTPAQACRSTFWGYVTLRHIVEERIESYYLAANGGTQSGGLERIDRALSNGSVDDIDGIVRTALRRFSGLPEARGNRTVYVDCPFGRAWWRCHIAERVYTITSADPGKVMDVLRINQTYWEELVSSVVSKNSQFGDENIRAALIWALSEQIDDENSPLFRNTALRDIIKRIGVRLAWQELAVFETKDLRNLFEKELLNPLL